jgi:hypothetical protein
VDKIKIGDWECNRVTGGWYVERVVTDKCNAGSFYGDGSFGCSALERIANSARENHFVDVEKAKQEPCTAAQRWAAVYGAAHWCLPNHSEYGALAERAAKHADAAEAAYQRVKDEKKNGI